MVKRVYELGFQSVFSRSNVSEYSRIAMQLIYVIETFHGIFNIQNEVYSICSTYSSFTRTLKKCRCSTAYSEKSFAMVFEDNFKHIEIYICISLTCTTIRLLYNMVCIAFILHLQKHSK